MTEMTIKAQELMEDPCVDKAIKNEVKQLGLEEVRIAVDDDGKVSLLNDQESVGPDVSHWEEHYETYFGIDVSELENKVAHFYSQNHDDIQAILETMPKHERFAFMYGSPLAPNEVVNPDRIERLNKTLRVEGTITGRLTSRCDDWLRKQVEAEAFRQTSFTEAKLREALALVAPRPKPYDIGQLCDDMFAQYLKRNQDEAECYPWFDK